MRAQRITRWRRGLISQRNFEIRGKAVLSLCDIASRARGNALEDGEFQLPSSGAGWMTMPFVFACRSPASLIGFPRKAIRFYPKDRSERLVAAGWSPNMKRPPIGSGAGSVVVIRRRSGDAPDVASRTLPSRGRIRARGCRGRHEGGADACSELDETGVRIVANPAQAEGKVTAKTVCIRRKCSWGISCPRMDNGVK